MASRQQLGLTLRLLGPTVELIGLILFLNDPAGRTRVLGLPARTIGLALLAVGLVLVLAGLWMSRRVRRRPSFDLELGPDPERDPTV